MDDASGKTASTSLAVVEKKPQRPGGCVGIFFQLVDWNRRFAKKKLFSKKLLPPVRLKKGSKKFGGDEKLPKHRLIADENSGGFPNLKKGDGDSNAVCEQKHEMRTPGIVARLMGLEAMPAIQREKLKKKASLSGTENSKGDKYVDGHGKFERQNSGTENGEAKHEVRPQKLQKTGICDRRPVTRFGAEALQLKNVLSRSRKQHPKLLSPVKSPRNLSGKNTSRLIGAATRILEPGLQRSRSKCALTYSSVVHPPPATENLMEDQTGSSLKLLENSNYFTGDAAAQNGQSSSCRNCAHLLVKDFAKFTEEQPAVFSPMSKNVYLPSGQMGDPRVTILCPMRGKGNDQEASPFYTPSVDVDQPCFEHMEENKPSNREGERPWQASSPQRKLQRDVCPSICSKQKGLGQKQMLQERDKLPLRSKLSRPQSSRVSTAANATNETRNFIALNRNLNNHTRLPIPSKMDNCHQLDTYRKIGERVHDSLSPVRKRRSMNIARQNECRGFVNSTLLKSTNVRSNVMPGKDTERMLHLQEGRSGDGMKNEIDVVSFTFSSQMKRKTGIHAKVEEKRKQNATNCEIPVKKSALLKNDSKRSSQKPHPLNGDCLGELLEQKLRELTCQEEDEPTFGDTPPKKTTAMILQELISALTTERPFDQDDLASKLKNHKTRLCTDDHQAKMSSPTRLQVKSKSTKSLVGNLQDREHLSPGSVLEASFSTDSCASSSLDDGSRHNRCAELIEFCSERHSFEPDADLLDSATSLSMGKFYRESIITLLENISEVFSKINPSDVLLKGGKLTHAKEVILNTEIVFGNAALPGSFMNGGFSLSLFVLNELETLANVMAANFIGSASVGFDDTKGDHLFKGFVFDCVIEYLDSRFSRYSNSGFNAWMRLPLRMKTEMLIGDIVELVRRWAELAGLIPDELIEYEMSHSLGKWIDFELEAFETGAEIDLQILQTLIEELLVDFTGLVL